MVTFGVSTKSYQTATLNMVTLFFMIMTAFIEIIMPHLISTSYALEEAGYDIEIDNGILIVDDYDTNNGVSVKIETL